MRDRDEKMRPRVGGKCRALWFLTTESEETESEEMSEG